MSSIFLRPQDAQLAPPVCCCQLCGCELYPEDSLYLIDEQVLCPDCLGAFAVDYFQHRRFLAADLTAFPQL